MNNLNKYERYQRQLTLKEWNTAGQDKLSNAKVLVVGAGGLGCPALQYLAAAGVGTIGIIDFDLVELSNLQRQTLFTVEDIGKHKALIAAERLRKFNPDIRIIENVIKLETKNALRILKDYDIVVDGSDNFATRYLVNDACVILDKPLVYGAVLRFEGQFGVFNFQDKQTGVKANYRDLFPEPPLPSTVPSCNEAGVVGVLPGIVGAMQAAEAIKIITGIGKPLYNKIVSYNLLENSFYECEILPAIKSKTLFPKSEPEFFNFNYEWFCSHIQQEVEISLHDFEQLRKSRGLTIIDVREIGEQPLIGDFSFIHLPLESFKLESVKPFIENEIVIFCQSGKRSLIAAKKVKEKFPASRVYSLRGGIESWKKFRDETVLEKSQMHEHE